MYQNWSWGVLGSDRNRHRPGQRCLRDCPSLIWSDPFPKNLVMNYMVNLYSYRFTWRSSSDQIRSVAQSCPTLCDPMNCSTPGLPVHHQLPKLTETHVHRVSDAIQPSHPLSSPSPLAPNPSQHQSLTKVGSPETPGITGKFDLEVQNEAGQRHG